MRLILALLCVALLAPLATAQSTVIELEAHDGGGEYWFQLAGSTERNPDLDLQAGTEYTVNLVNQGSTPHNVHFGGVDQATAFIGPGKNTTLSFTMIKTSGDAMYWCDPHRSLGMEGVATASTASEDAPGVGLLGFSVVLLAVAFLIHRR